MILGTPISYILSYSDHYSDHGSGRSDQNT